MARGDIYEATAGESTDLYYVDTELYGVAEYGGAYIIDDDRPALVDTGMGRNYELILDALAELEIAPEDITVIAPTHVHLDHAGGAGYLAEACPNADVCCYEAGARFLVDPTGLWEGTKAAVGDQIDYYEEPKPIPDGRIVELADGDTVDLGTHALETHHAPGHAFHQAVFYDPANDGVFTADAAGLYVEGMDQVHPTSPPSDFDLEECLADVEMLKDLSPSALYFGHFGDHPTGDLLDEYAAVLTEWVDRVAAKRAELEDDDAVIEHFVDSATGADIWGEWKAREEAKLNVKGVLAYLDDREA
jgi:glyoxylase-like metal-dependent hydrolase (beta-lactamase superfamily II)